MRSEGRPVAYPALIGYLNDHHLMGKAGGNGEVAGLMRLELCAHQFGYYVETLRAKHLERTIIQGGVAVIESAYSHDPSLMQETATQQLSQISDAIRGKKERGMGEQLEEWMATWHDIRLGKKESSMPTRWTCWNRRLMGLRPGYTVISGPRGSGKSTLAGNLLTDACIHRGGAGLLVNYEMPVRMSINRIISDIGGVESAHLFCPDITKPDRSVERKITQCLQKIRDSKLTIIHDVRMGAEDIANMAKAIKARHGTCKVLVDYIQIMPPPKLDKDCNREQEVAKTSAVLRALSKELDDTVIGLSQLNKDGTTRESSSIEADADDVYRVERYKKPDGSTTDDGVLVFKNRSGPEGMNLPLTLKEGYYRFIEKGSENDEHAMP
jgi:replicative DNA helicase